MPVRLPPLLGLLLGSRPGRVRAAYAAGHAEAFSLKQSRSCGAIRANVCGPLWIIVMLLNKIPTIINEMEFYCIILFVLLCSIGIYLWRGCRVGQDAVAARKFRCPVRSKWPFVGVVVFFLFCVFPEIRF